MFLRVLLFTAIVTLGGLQPASAQGRIGTAVRVVNQVTADQSLIVTGDGVAQNQTIEVAPQSIGELKLDDSTKLALGPGAKLILDKFVYDPDKSGGDVAISLTKGAFRFVTGAADKKGYKIKTPSAAISVRGTVFDIYIAPNGVEWILLHEGAITVCNSRSECRVVENPCNVLQLSPGGPVGVPGGWNAQAGAQNVSFDEAFPFVNTPPEVDPAVYHTRLQVEANQCPNPRNERTPGQRADYEFSPGQGSTGGSPLGPKPVSMAPPPQQYQPPSAPGDLPPGTQNMPSFPLGISVYAGGQAGRGANKDLETNTTCTAPGLFFNDALISGCAPSDRVPERGTLTARQRYETEATGFMGGGYAGVNFRTGPVLLGVEADFSYADIDTGPPRNANGVEFYVGGSDVAQSINWMSTVRGRAGLALGNVLVFATGGLAIADVEYDYRLNSFLGDQLLASASASEIKTGWTAGGGVELGFGLWSLKTEYLYYDLGAQQLSSNVIANFDGVPPFDTGIKLAPKFETDGHIVRTGISFRFN